MSEPAAPDIVERLRDEADLCRNETADDVARLLDQAADEIERLRRVNEGLHSAIAVLGMRIKSAADETPAAQRENLGHERPGNLETERLMAWREAALALLNEPDGNMVFTGGKMDRYGRLMQLEIDERTIMMHK